MLLHGLKHEEHKKVPPQENTHPPQPQILEQQQQYEQHSRKRAREDETSHYGHKDDGNKAAGWQHTATEQPVQNTLAVQPYNQQHYVNPLLPNPEHDNKHAEGDQAHRLPSIKHLQLDPTALRRNWEYGANPRSYSPYPNPSYSSSQQHQRSPLKATQSISPPRSPPQATELVQVKTNTYGFIETTFTNVPAKKAHRRRPANIDKASLYCHTCGSKNTPEWRRGPQGPATLCNACGLAYAKRLRQEEENNAASKSAKLEQDVSPHPSPHPLPHPSPHSSPHPSHVSPHPSPSMYPEQYPTLALSDLYQQAGLFQGYEHIAGDPSPVRPTFRSAHNRPNGHTFHQYTPPVTTRTPSSPYLTYPPPAPSFASLPPPAPTTSFSSLPNPNAHLPMATTTTTTTTTSLYPYGLSPSDLSMPTHTEPPNTTPSTSSAPLTTTLSSSNHLPVLTTLSSSTPDDTPALTYSTLNRYPTLPYRTIPTLSSLSSLYPTSSPTSPTYPPLSTLSTYPFTSTTSLAALFTPPASSLSTPSASALIPIPTAPPPPSIANPTSTAISPSPSTPTSSTPSIPPTISIPTTTSSTPSPNHSPTQSPNHSPTSAARTHSPSLTPITTIAALSNGAALPSL